MPKYLVDDSTGQEVPLKSINFDVSLICSQAKIIMSQDYVNNTNSALTTRYVFPIEEGFAFSKLTLQVDDEIIETIIDEREKIEMQFQNSLLKNITAVEGTYEMKQSRDSFTIMLGNIPPKSKIQLTITIYATLSVEDMCYCFRLPLVYIPTYNAVKTKQQELIASDFDDFFAQKFGTSLVETIHKPIQRNGCTYKWDISVRVFTLGPLIRISSKNHKIVPKVIKECLATIELDPQELNRAPEQDFVLLVQDSKLGQLTVMQAEHDGDQGIIINYIPDFRSEIKKQQLKELIQQNGIVMPSGVCISPESDEMVQPTQQFNIKECDYYFLIDRSCSMVGESIVLTVEALKLFLYSLPFGSRFNIISFGSDFECLFPNVVNYTDQTLEAAIKRIEDFTADMGGTEILDAINYIYMEFDKYPEQFKQIFLITDGKVDNVDQITKLIQSKYKPNQRLHTFGIGSGASTQLVKEAAKCGGGMFYFINNKFDIEKYVIEALCLNLLPYLIVTSISLLDENRNVVTKVDDIMEIPNGSYLNHTMFIPNEVEIKYAEVTILDPNQELEHKSLVEVYQNRFLNFSIMAASVTNHLKTIRIEKEIVALSIKHQVISNQTSFFASKSLMAAAGIEKKYVKIPTANNSIVIDITLAVVQSGQQHRMHNFRVNRFITVCELQNQLIQYLQLDQQSQSVDFEGLSDINKNLQYYDLPNQAIIQTRIRSAGGGNVINIVNALGDTMNSFEKSDIKQFIPIITKIVESQKLQNYHMYYRTHERIVYIDDINTQLQILETNAVDRVVVCDYIRVLVKQMAKDGFVDNKLDYHQSFSLQDILAQVGCNNQDVNISINGRLFKQDKNKTLKALNITSQCVITVENKNFKSIVYLQTAQGFWNQSLLNRIGSGINQWKDKQPMELQVMSQECLLTLLGLKLLQVNYSKDAKEWRMIERKAISYLKEQLKADEVQIPKMISVLVI